MTGERHPGLSPAISEVECSGMKARASGAVRWRRCNEAEWKRQELSESGSAIRRQSAILPAQAAGAAKVAV